MDHRTLEKINALAKSLKQNRLAVNMDEAVQMAKNMLTKDASGNELSSETLSDMKDNLDEDKKELNEISDEASALKDEVDSNRHEKASQETHAHTEEYHQVKKDVEETKEEVKALSDMKKDAAEEAKLEQDRYDAEEKAKEDLPGEEHKKSE